MKWILLLILLVVISIPLILANPDTFTLEVGQTKDFSGSILKLKNLKSDKAVISVGNESGIFAVGEEKTISNVVIKLNEINYIGQNDGSVNIDARALRVCGDNMCDDGESKSNCCKDCGCQTEYDCIDNQCAVHVEDECHSDNDCDDNKETTLDKCSGGRPRKCSYILSVICEKDLDCEDSNPCTKDVCRNNDCFNEKIEDCVSGKEGETVNITSEENKSADENITKEPNLKPLKKVSIFEKILQFFKKLFSSPGSESAYNNSN